MSKIQSRVGVSLASLYDVRGSISGLEELRTAEVAVVHEMGAVAFSERLGGTIRRRSVSVPQSTDIDEVLDDLPGTPYMLHSIAVFVDADATRINRLAVLATDSQGRETPLWAWNDPQTKTIRARDDAAPAADLIFLEADPPWTQTPVLMIGELQEGPGSIGDFAMRGGTTPFGAGNIEVTLLLRISSASVGLGSLSGVGLPVPSW